MLDKQLFFVLSDSEKLLHSLNQQRLIEQQLQKEITDKFHKPRKNERSQQKSIQDEKGELVEEKPKKKRKLNNASKKEESKQNKTKSQQLEECSDFSDIEETIKQCEQEIQIPLETITDKELIIVLKKNFFVARPEDIQLQENPRIEQQNNMIQHEEQRQDHIEISSQFQNDLQDAENKIKIEENKKQHIEQLRLQLLQRKEEQTKLHQQKLEEQRKKQQAEVIVDFQPISAQQSPQLNQNEDYVEIFEEDQSGFIEAENSEYGQMQMVSQDKCDQSIKSQKNCNQKFEEEESQERNQNQIIPQDIKQQDETSQYGNQTPNIEYMQIEQNVVEPINPQFQNQQHFENYTQRQNSQLTDNNNINMQRKEELLVELDVQDIDYIYNQNQILTPQYSDTSSNFRSPNIQEQNENSNQQNNNPLEQQLEIIHSQPQNLSFSRLNQQSQELSQDIRSQDKQNSESTEKEQASLQQEENQITFEKIDQQVLEIVNQNEKSNEQPDALEEAQSENSYDRSAESSQERWGLVFMSYNPDITICQEMNNKVVNNEQIPQEDERKEEINQVQLNNENISSNQSINQEAAKEQINEEQQINDQSCSTVQDQNENNQYCLFIENSKSKKRNYEETIEKQQKMKAKDVQELEDEDIYLSKDCRKKQKITNKILEVNQDNLEDESIVNPLMPNKIILNAHTIVRRYQENLKKANQIKDTGSQKQQQKTNNLQSQKSQLEQNHDIYLQQIVSIMKQRIKESQDNQDVQETEIRENSTQSDQSQLNENENQPEEQENQGQEQHQTSQNSQDEPHGQPMEIELINQNNEQILENVDYQETGQTAQVNQNQQENSEDVLQKQSVSQNIQIEQQICLQENGDQMDIEIQPQSQRNEMQDQQSVSNENLQTPQTSQIEIGSPIMNNNQQQEVETIKNQVQDVEYQDYRLKDEEEQQTTQEYIVLSQNVSSVEAHEEQQEIQDSQMKRANKNIEQVLNERDQE